MKRNLVINFHVIDNVEWFEQVLLLLKSKYTMVDLDFLENENNYNKKNGYCHITFDDGDRSFYTAAFPILQKHNVPATIFISPKIITKGGNFWFQEIVGYKQDIMINILANKLDIPLETIKEIPFRDIFKCMPLHKIHEMISLYQMKTDTTPKPCQNMNLEETLEVEQSELITVGAHTLNHPILRNESDDNCEKEISGSIIDLEKALGKKVNYFAYPNGDPEFDFDAREINCLKKNGISMAFSTETRFLAKRDNKFAVPRFGISFGSMRFIKVKLFLGSYWDRLRALLRHTEAKSRNDLAPVFEQIKKSSMN